MNRVIQRVYNLYHRKYDFYYLKTQIRLLNEAVNTVIAGSSYAAFGFEPEQGEVNLGLPSQDLYYSDKLIRKAVESCENLKRVVLILGYYVLYSDLSMTKSVSESQRIQDVYSPILHDIHNQVLNEEPKHFREQCLCIVDQVICGFLRMTFFLGPVKKYFNRKLHSRFARRRITWNDASVSWEDLPKEQRAIACAQRAMEHSKAFKYTNTYEENVEIVKQLSKFLKDSGIELHIYVAPFPEDYLKCMYGTCPEKIEEFRSNMQALSDTYVDVNRKTVYEDDLFIDTDHLGDRGAMIFSTFMRDHLT